MHLITKGRKKQIFHDNVFNGSDNVNNVCKLSKITPDMRCIDSIISMKGIVT